MISEKEIEISELKRQNNGLQEENKNLKVEKATLQEKLDSTVKSDQKWQETLELQFSKIINQNSEKLTTLNQQKISEILTPFNKDLDNLQKKLDIVQQQSVTDREVLQTNIKNLF